MEKPGGFFRNIGETGGFTLDENVMQGDSLYAGNPPARKRRNVAQKSLIFNWYSDMSNIPLFSNDKLWPLHNTSLKLEFSFASNDFSLLKSTKETIDFGLQLEDAFLNLALVETSNAISLSRGVISFQDMLVEVHTIFKDTISKWTPITLFEKMPRKVYFALGKCVEKVVVVVH